jgi:hypothetical protein
MRRQHRSRMAISCRSSRQEDTGTRIGLDILRRCPTSTFTPRWPSAATKRRPVSRVPPGSGDAAPGRTRRAPHALAVGDAAAGDSRLAGRYQHDAIAIDPRSAAGAEVATGKGAHEDITHRAHLIAGGDRLAAVVNVLRAEETTRAIVFTRSNSCAGATRACWSPPTSRRAACTCPTSISSSTPICRGPPGTFSAGRKIRPSGKTDSRPSRS